MASVDLNNVQQLLTDIVHSEPVRFIAAGVALLVLTLWAINTATNEDK